MNCNCIKEVNERLRKHTGHEDAQLAVSFIFMEDGSRLEVPSIYAFYKVKKRDGTYAKKAKELSIIPSFCPFCGEKIDKLKGGEGL